MIVGRIDAGYYTRKSELARSEGGAGVAGVENLTHISQKGNASRLAFLTARHLPADLGQSCCNCEGNPKAK